MSSSNVICQFWAVGASAKQFVNFVACRMIESSDSCDSGSGWELGRKTDKVSSHNIDGLHYSRILSKVVNDFFELYL